MTGRERPCDMTGRGRTCDRARNEKGLSSGRERAFTRTRNGLLSGRERAPFVSQRKDRGGGGGGGGGVESEHLSERERTCDMQRALSDEKEHVTRRERRVTGREKTCGRARKGLC